MTSVKALKIFGIAIVALLISMAIFNYLVDAQCFYRCDTIDLNARSLNQFYQMAQRIRAYPETELIVLGSSRGETVSPVWLESVSGLKALNLSVYGGEIQIKKTLLKIARKGTKVKKVIWLADFFELLPESVDRKFKNTPALREYVDDPALLVGDSSMLSTLQSLIDHKTFEASVSFLSSGRKSIEFDKGFGSSLDYEKCTSKDYESGISSEKLKKEVDLIFDNWVRGVIRHKLSAHLFEQFENTLFALKQSGIDTVVVIGPYHERFMNRLKNEKPEIFEDHLRWIERLQGLENLGVKVLNYFEGIPGDDGSPVYWRDGVHFTCRSSYLMLNEVARSWR